MIVAVFSDVHGNLPALECFINCTKGKVDQYVCLGDVVNYGPWNDECLDLITALPNITLLEGNHEELFAGRKAVGNESSLVQSFYTHSIKFFSRIDMIKSLSKRINLNDYCCTHTIDNITVYEDTPINIKQNFIIGHSHYQYETHRSNYSLINPGSVGQNRKWINLINYLVFDTVRHKFFFESAKYDFDKFISELRARTYPPECIQYYLGKTIW